MAINTPVYEKSAVDLLSPMLTISQNIANRNKENWDRLSTGIKGLGEGLGGATAAAKRAADLESWAIEYKGDAYVEELEEQVRAAKAEIEQIDRAMKTIKAEDLGSLDEDRNGGTPNPNDVNTIELEGRRMFPDAKVQEEQVSIDPVTGQPEMSMGAKFNLESADVSIDDLIEYGKHRYKSGANGGK